MVSPDQIDNIVTLISLVGGITGIFFALKSQVKVLEKQVERLESLVNELRQDIKHLLTTRSADTN